MPTVALQQPMHAHRSNICVSLSDSKCLNGGQKWVKMIRVGIQFVTLAFYVEFSPIPRICSPSPETFFPDLSNPNVKF